MAKTRERFAFTGGVLSRLGPAGATRIQAWPPRSWLRTPDGDWQEGPARLDLRAIDTLLDANADALELFPGPDGRAGAGGEVPSWRAFRCAIPERAWSGVARYPNRLHFEMLQFAACSEGALDLLESSPGLAYAIAVSPEPAAQLVAGKQRVAAGALGFPKTAAAARALRKLAFDALSLGRLDQLRTAMGQAATMRRIGHVPKLTGFVLSILAVPRLERLVGDALLLQIAEAEIARARTLYHLAHDVLRMHERFEPGCEPTPAHDATQLLARHERLAERVRRGPRGPNRQFPAPPIAPRPGQIEAIVDTWSLASEGRAQHNCCGSYGQSIERGGLYLYRVLAPERATLSIRRTPNGWRMEEVKGPGNRAVRAETVAAVQRWLADAGQVSAPRRRPRRTQPRVAPQHRPELTPEPPCVETTRARAEQMLDAFAGLVDDASTATRRAAIIALEVMPAHPRWQTVIAMALEDTDAEIRRRAADMLADRGGPEVLPGLQARRRDLDTNVRTAAAMAIWQIRQRGSCAQAATRRDSAQLSHPAIQAQR